MLNLIIGIWSTFRHMTGLCEHQLLHGRVQRWTMILQNMNKIYKSLGSCSVAGDKIWLKIKKRIQQLLSLQKMLKDERLPAPYSWHYYIRGSRNKFFISRKIIIMRLNLMKFNKLSKVIKRFVNISFNVPLTIELNPGKI